MTDCLPKSDRLDAASVEGLGEFFDSGHNGHDGNGQDLPLCNQTDETAADWTPEIAAKVLRKSVRTIRRMLQDGELEGYKVPGPRRPEWRIKPVGHDLQSPSNRSWSDKVRLEELQKQIADLRTELERAQHDLQGASFRNGYLEAKLEQREKEVAERDTAIKLLTDSQHKPSRWARFTNWFIGR